MVLFISYLTWSWSLISHWMAPLWSHKVVQWTVHSPESIVEQTHHVVVCSRNTQYCPQCHCATLLDSATPHQPKFQAESVMSLFVNIVNLWFTWKWTLPKYCITPLSCPLIATRSPIWYPIKPSSEYKFLAEFLSDFFFSNELWNLLPSPLTLIFLWYLLSVSADVLLLLLWIEAVFAKVSCRSNLNCFFLIFLSSDLKLYRVLTKFIMVTITLNSSHHHNEWLVHLPHK